VGISKLCIAGAIVTAVTLPVAPSAGAASPAAVSFQRAKISVKETNVDGTVQLRLRLSKRVDRPVTVRLASTGGNAEPGVDYSIPDHVVIPARTRNVPVPLMVHGDTDVEGNETFTIGIVSARNATVGTRSSVAGTIVDDDTTTATPPVIDTAEIQLSYDGFNVHWVAPTGAVVSRYDATIGVPGEPPLASGSFEPNVSGWASTLPRHVTPDKNVVATLHAVSSPPTPVVTRQVEFIYPPPVITQAVIYTDNNVLVVRWDGPADVTVDHFDVSVAISGGPPFASATLASDVHMWRQPLNGPARPGPNVVVQLVTTSTPRVNPTYALVNFVPGSG
jgi:hypothetical protein